MSFPRAKIQRFNDVMNSVPSPTKYDPKIGDKVKGGCILKGETKQSVVSETASACSGKSCHTPIFRTPQLPKRHNCLGISEKGSHSAFKSISLKSDDIEFLNNDIELEELKALRVECSNKTETINDMGKHIQDLKTQLSNHEKSKSKLEIYISELEAAKSNLECIKSNNENYEQQICSFKSQLRDMENKMGELVKTKEELQLKIEETEKKNNKLEEINLEYERKLISLEGTIEQLQMEQKNKEQLIAEMMQKEKVYEMNHQVSMECLQGKISTLENEIKELDSSKSKNEAVIFALEAQITNLNCTIETLKTDKFEVETSSKELKLNLEKMEEACKIHNDTVIGLEMELETRVKELQHLREINADFKTEMYEIKKEMEKERALFKEKVKELSDIQEKQLENINKKLNEQALFLAKEKENFKSKCLSQANSHAEEILKLQNDYESKLLAQMQESTDKVNALQAQLDEKDASINKLNIKHMNLLKEWETKLQNAENNFSNLLNRLESEHVDNVEEIKGNYKKKLEINELNSSKVIDMKNKEIDLLTEQYKEIVDEVKGLLICLEKKDQEIKNLSKNNSNMNARLKIMLEEIKLLNKENESKSESLTKMTTKYNDEFSKNEHLSCKLGELDTKIHHLKNDLNKKIEDWKRTSDELKKSKHTCDKLMNKKCDLEGTVADLQERLTKLVKELNEKKVNYEECIRNLNDELNKVKTHCKKFEIITGNTSKALEALRKRLIESEKEVEKLDNQNLALHRELEKSDMEKNDFQSKYEDLLETKTDLETALDDYLTNNKKLSEKCANLEALCEDFEGKIRVLNKVNDDLKAEKENHIQVMKELIKKQELQLIETERATLDQVEQVSQTLTEKLEFFMKFSTEKVNNLTIDIKNLKLKNEELSESLKSKTEDYENLFTDYEILKTTVDISVKESENLKKKCEEQITDLEKLKNAYEEMTYKKQKLEEQLTEKKKSYIELEEKNKGLQDSLDEIKTSLEKEKQHNLHVTNMVADLELKIQNNKKDEEARSKNIREMENKISEIECKLREKDAEIATCQEEKMLCMQELKSLTRDKNDLAFNLKVAEKTVETSEKLMEEFRAKKIDAEENYMKQKKVSEEHLAEKNCLYSELMFLKEENGKLKREKEMLEVMEERKNFYKENCQMLDKLNAELRDENTNLKNDFNEIHFFLQEKEKKVTELEKRCSDLESLIGPFREQLERYETERMLIENDREELRKQHLEQAAELGHRNHKQKIQHVVKLKNTLLETRKENEKLTLEITNLKKKVQKLQEQLGLHPKRLFIGGKRPDTTPFRGKENSGLMPQAAGIITPMVVKQEPASPGSPLRNRNQ